MPAQLHEQFPFDFSAGEEEPPPLVPAAARAIHCWRFCGGNLALLPLYDALHGVPDWELMTELLGTIREQVTNG